MKVHLSVSLVCLWSCTVAWCHHNPNIWLALNNCWIWTRGKLFQVSNFEQAWPTCALPPVPNWKNDNNNNNNNCWIWTKGKLFHKNYFVLVSHWACMDLPNMLGCKKYWFSICPPTAVVCMLSGKAIALTNVNFQPSKVHLQHSKVHRMFPNINLLTFATIGVNVCIYKLQYTYKVRNFYTKTTRCSCL